MKVGSITNGRQGTHSSGRQHGDVCTGVRVRYFHERQKGGAQSSSGSYTQQRQETYVSPIPSIWEIYIAFMRSWKPAIGATDVSHAACKHEFRREKKKSSIPQLRGVFYFIFIKSDFGRCWPRKPIDDSMISAKRPTNGVNIIQAPTGVAKSPCSKDEGENGIAR